MLKNVSNGMVYIGSSCNLRARKTEHFARLKRDRHENSYLQRAYNKYGENSFVFAVLLVCGDDNLIMYEQKIMDFYVATKSGFGYNLCPVAGRNTGITFTEKSKEKMRAARVGMKLSEQHKKRISESLKGNKRRVGHKHSDERKAAISAMFKGRVHSPETIAKMNESRKRTRELKLTFTVT